MKHAKKKKVMVRIFMRKLSQKSVHIKDMIYSGIRSIGTQKNTCIIVELRGVSRNEIVLLKKNG